MIRKATTIIVLTLLALGASAQVSNLQGMEDVNKVKDLTLDSLDKVRQARVKPGSSRRGNNPVLFLVGGNAGFKAVLLHR